MRKILLVAADNCKIPSFGFRCKKAFEKLNCRVETFNYRYYQLHRTSIGRSWISGQLIKRAISLNPDLVFVDKGESIREGIIEKISDNGIKTANWTLDDPFGEFLSFNNIRNRNEYDYFYVFDPYYARKLKNTGQQNAFYLPCAVDPDIHHEVIPFKLRSYNCDLSFVGSHHSNREEFLSNFSGYNMKIWGFRWNEVNKTSSIYAKIQKKVYYANKTLSDVKETCKIFNTTKININVHYPHSKEGVNLRTFEIPSAKSFEICDSYKELSRLFKTGKEIETYSDICNLKEKIGYYLENPIERQKIALRGYQRIIKDHTFVNRMKEVLSKI